MSMTFDPYASRNSLVDDQRAGHEDVLMTNPTALAELEAYWSALPRTRGLPKRTDLDPASLGALLENAFVLERIAPGIARIRVAGRAIGALLGVEPRGLPITAAFLPASRAAMANYIEAAFSGPSIVELPLNGPRALGQPCLQGRIMILPLLDDFGRVSRAVGMLVMSGRKGLGGRRFVISDIEPPRVEPVEQLRVVAGECKTDRLVKKAEDRPALRLVVSNN
ncbi:MAG: PAS domain-containing protein [Octadecabacter sp.]|nr:PAS domain-containing protein [Octadecabacter sp.]